MSHSRNMVCYVITFNNKVGVDTEFYNTTINRNIRTIRTCVYSKRNRVN